MREKLGFTKVLAVYDIGVYKAGIVDPIFKTVESEGIEIVHFNKFRPIRQIFNGGGCTNIKQFNVKRLNNSLLDKEFYVYATLMI